MLLALRSLWEVATTPSPTPDLGNFSCNVACITCPPGWLGLPNDPNNPYLNLSSEARDVDNYIGRAYTRDFPPLGKEFYALGCIGWCVGTTQEEADLCAARQNMICNSTNWPTITLTDPTAPPGPDNPTVSSPSALYGNTAQTCQQPGCNDGTNSYTTPANTFYAFTQAQANTQAYNFACAKAAYLDEICLSDISNSRVCYLTQSTVSITCTNSASGQFNVFSGSLPDGMAIDQSSPVTVDIIGTPISTGVFNFTISFVEDVTNYIGYKDYTLEVFGISNSSPLTECTKGFPYSQALTITGTPVDTYTFSVVSGALPSGLTLNPSTGLISGTPTTVGNYIFTVQIEDEL